MHCTYNNEFDLYADSWIKNNLEAISKLDTAKIREYERNINVRVNQLWNRAFENLNDQNLETILGPLYINIYILLHIMIKTKAYSYKKPYDKEMDEFLYMIDDICLLFEEYSSSLRSDEIKKIAKKL